MTLEALAARLPATGGEHAVVCSSPSWGATGARPTPGLPIKRSASHISRARWRVQHSFTLADRAGRFAPSGGGIATSALCVGVVARVAAGLVDRPRNQVRL